MTHHKKLAAIATLLATTQIPMTASAQSNEGFQITPGTVLTVYGFVRAEAFYDLDRIQGDLTNTGGLQNLPETDGNFNTSVRVSRLGFRITSETDIGTIGGQLEYDLFGSGGSAELRLRHANITVNNWLFGQFWTNFMPLGQYPTTSDFNGPVGITFARVPQVRYSGTSGNVDYSFSIEEAVGESDDPAFTAAAQYNSDAFTGRVAALLGTAGSGAQTDDSFGFTASVGVTPWEGGVINATYTTGEGIGSYFIGGGPNLVNGVANDVDGFTVEVRQQISPKWNIGIAYGQEEYGEAGSAAGAFTDLETVHLNAFYNPTERITVGLEYIIGENTGANGNVVEADRIGTSVTFRF